VKSGYSYLGKLGSTFGTTFKFSKNTVNKFSLNINQKFADLKNYSKSDSFEDDIDYLIINLQIFDSDLVVSNMDKLNRNQRINRKLKLIKKSFKNLNVDFAPIGIAAGSAFGPNGAAAGAFLGTYLFVGCVAVAVYGKYSSVEDVFPVAI
jgi:hypothetical protein